MKRSIIIAILAAIMLFYTSSIAVTCTSAVLNGPGTVNVLGDGGGSPMPGSEGDSLFGDGGGSPMPGQ